MAKQLVFGIFGPGGALGPKKRKRKRKPGRRGKRWRRVGATCATTCNGKRLVKSTCRIKRR